MSMAIRTRRQSPPREAPTAIAMISLSSSLLLPVLGADVVVAPEVVCSSLGFTMELPVVLGSCVVGDTVVGDGGAENRDINSTSLHGLFYILSPATSPRAPMFGGVRT